MTKYLGRFFLALCIFLVSGYCALHAHAYKVIAHDSFIKSIEEQVYSNTGSLHPSLTVMVKPASSKEKKKAFKFETSAIEEENERESFGSKKHGGRHYAILIFNSQQPGYFSFYVNKSLLFCKHFSFPSSYASYLKLLVIRI